MLVSRRGTVVVCFFHMISTGAGWIFFGLSPDNSQILSVTFFLGTIKIMSRNNLWCLLSNVGSNQVVF